ncbi:MAG: hypothetical protein ABEJ03_00880 [Candidatus Nanohaloarchaea archaeon]
MRDASRKRTKLLLLAVLTVGTTFQASGTVKMEKGVILDPSNSPASYYFQENNSFNSVTVYDSKVNFSSTNTTTTSSNPAVNVSVWNYTGGKTMLKNGSKLKFNYNVSADTDFYDLNSSLYYRVSFNGSFQRQVTSQNWLNVSVPGTTNLTVKARETGANQAPDEPFSPQPSNTASDVSYSPTLEVNVTDPDGDSMDVRFWNASDDTLIGSNSGVSNGSETSVTWSGLSPGKQYSWYAEADDGSLTNNSSTFTFTTNYEPDLVSDSQFYDNFTGHEFEVEANGNDTDGQSDISSCKLKWKDGDGNSGLVSGDLDTSYGDSQEVKCRANISSTISGVTVGESIQTSVRFFDGLDWANSSFDSNTVPNKAPTKSTSKTDLGGFLTDHTPAVTWSGQNDPDGDSLTVKAYTGTGSTPTTQDNSASASSASMDLGNNVNLEDGTSYYYRLEFCDSYGACSAYTSSDSFRMNKKPNVSSYALNDSRVSKGESVYLKVNVTDEQMESVKFTVKEGGSTIINSQNGTWKDSDTWTSPSWTADQEVTYDYTIDSTDNRSETTTNSSSFLIENDPSKLVTDTQSLTNKTGHAYDTEGYAFDQDGDDDFTSCKIKYSANSQTGTVSGSIDTSYGNSTEAKCTGTLSNAQTGVKVLQKAETSVRFHDGKSWANTSFTSNTVPNNAPVAAGSKKDLGMYLTDHTPAVTWSGESDPDGDSLTVQAYTGTTSSPTTLDSTGSASSASLDLGNNVNLNDGTTYYYRLQFCDTWECSSYVSSDKFGMNEEPSLSSIDTNVSDPSLNDVLEVRANVTDSNLESVNFTVKEAGTKIIDGENGTWIDSDSWKSSSFKADKEARYNYTVEAVDNASETTSSFQTFNTGFKPTGTYTRTFATTDKVRAAKVTIHGNKNGGSFNIKANTSQSSVKTLENSTWKNLSKGLDLTVKFELTAGSTGSPNITSYSVDYKTDYSSPGSYKSTVRDLGSNSSLGQITVSETQPSGTNATYEVRTGPGTTIDSDWTSWDLCLETCESGIDEENRYLQFRINLSGTSTKSPTVDTFKVNYR